MKNEGMAEDDASKTLIAQTWGHVQLHRKSAANAGNSIVTGICASFGKEHSLGGIEAIGRHRFSEESFRRARKHVSRSVSAAFVDEIDALLPPQPWRQGVHIQIARELGCRASKVSAAIRQLMDAGRRYEQLNGVLFDSAGNKIAPANTARPLP